ncbi:MAG: hypothetical protein H7Y41_03030 [Hyphomonadaceae bacterium]|nr:hypothetical protein [Clostridia bacterium]
MAIDTDFEKRYFNAIDKQAIPPWGIQRIGQIGVKWEKSDIHQRNKLAYQAKDLNERLIEINASPFWAKPILSDVYRKWYSAQQEGNYKQAAKLITSKNALYESIDQGQNTFDKVIWLANNNHPCEECINRDGNVYTLEQCTHLQVHPQCGCKLLPLGPYATALGSLNSDRSRLTVFLNSNVDSNNQNNGFASFLDGIQLVLDIAGLVPVYGEIADGLNALIYLGRGDVLNAGLSAGSMVPFAGWTFTGGKLVGKGLKVVKNAEKVEGLIEGAGKALGSSDNLIKSANSVVKGNNTAVGRAFQKHTVREGTAFTGEVTGNAAKNTEQGMNYINKILNDPNATSTVRNTKAYGDVLDIRLPNGMGARWSADENTFVGFLEKFTTK